MLLTGGGDIPYLKEKYADSMYENEFLLPAFIREYPIYNIRGGNPISVIEKTLSAPVLVVSDKHELKANAKWQWGGDKLEQTRKIALKLFIDFARKC